MDICKLIRDARLMFFEIFFSRGRFTYKHLQRNTFLTSFFLTRTQLAESLRFLNHIYGSYVVLRVFHFFWACFRRFTFHELPRTMFIIQYKQQKNTKLNNTVRQKVFVFSKITFCQSVPVPLVFYRFIKVFWNSKFWALLNYIASQVINRYSLHLFYPYHVNFSNLIIFCYSISYYN